MALLAPYKAKVDSIMYRVVGTAEMSMDKGAPESLLSNLLADVLRNAAAQVLGKPARSTPGINFKVILFILFGFLNCYKYNE